MNNKKRKTPSLSDNATAVDVCVVGGGEYVTGMGVNSSATDKSAGVVGLVLFHLRSLGRIGRIIFAATTNRRDAVASHFAEKIRYSNVSDLAFEWFPKEELSTESYIEAIASLTPGSIVAIFVPDHLHFRIAKLALDRGHHCLLTKPAVMTEEHHTELVNLADAKNLILATEFHKRWDPIYRNARQQSLGLGAFSFFNSYMSQPVHQISTFRWAGVHSDISFYLNSHHVDLLCWFLEDGNFKPTSVSALASTGVVKGPPYNRNPMGEDTITLTVQWEDDAGQSGHSVHTASWIAPRSDVHSQQRFFYAGQSGDMTIDQAHRGFVLAQDGLRSLNPLYMNYTPGPTGEFDGTRCYGYMSIDYFVRAVEHLRADANLNAAEVENMFQLASMRHSSALQVTKILEAGRQSLNEKKIITIN